MNIKEMHYSFKSKLNKVDSQNYTNLKIPEIDWALNEAQDIFIKTIVNPEFKPYSGIPVSKRKLSDIRTIITGDENEMIYPSSYGFITIPDDYYYFSKGKVLISTEKCGAVKAKLIIREHDEDYEDGFYNTSYKWREVSGTFSGHENGVIQLQKEEGTEFISAGLKYIRKPIFMHNAEDFRNGSYRSLKGDLLSGSVDCELPDNGINHIMIVDLAVLIVSGEIQSQDYNLKLTKLRLNNE